MSDSRAEFEAWCRSRNQDTTRDDRPDPALAWGYLNMITHELWVGWDAAWNRRAQPERKLTDAQAHEILCRMSEHVDDWADRLAEEPSAEQCSGEALRFILAAQPAAATVPDAELIALLPSSYYMDPPDGGSVSVLEQLQRMAKDAGRYRHLRNTHTWEPTIWNAIDFMGPDEEFEVAFDFAIDAAMGKAAQPQDDGEKK